MKNRYRIFRRENGIYYSIDRVATKRNSLNTTDLIEAKRLLNVLNKACQQPAVNLQIAQVYLQHSDPEFGKRTWQLVMDEMGKLKIGETKKRWDVAMKDKSFDHLRTLPLSKTLAEAVFDALNQGTVSTNVFLRRLHNFALDMSWILRPIVPKRQWPPVCYKEMRLGNCPKASTQRISCFFSGSSQRKNHLKNPLAWRNENLVKLKA